MGIAVTAECDKSIIQSMHENIKSNNYFLTFKSLLGELGNLNLDGIIWTLIKTKLVDENEQLMLKKHEF